MTTKPRLLCADCGSPMKLRHGRYGWFYGCVEFPVCHGTHGARPAGAPLGIPANAATKQARIKAHMALDALWSTKAERGEVYRQLAEHMGLQQSECHISMFDAEQCATVIAFAEKVADSGS